MGIVMIFLLFLLFAGLAAVSVKFFLDGKRQIRINAGYLVSSVLIIALDVICAFLVCMKSTTSGGYVLLIYYLLYAWLTPALILMILLTERQDGIRKMMVPTVAVCLLQTALIIAQLFGQEVFDFKRKMILSSTWIVAFEPEGNAFFLKYSFYTILWYINILIGIWLLVLIFRECPRMFRQRYLVFGSILVLHAAINGIATGLNIPVWIVMILYTAITVICLYYTGDYSKNRLREWSLDRFADNMSDGLILYDRNDELIHINAMIRRSLHAELAREFASREKLDEWLSNVSEVENVSLLTYEGPDRVYYFRIHTQELTDNDIKVGTLYILHDRSDTINRIKSMHKANEELEKAGRMKSDFLANMSHEIRTPMNAVIGMAEIALRENDPAKVDDYLRQIQNSGRNLLNIINDILDYSKIESGKMEIIEEEYCPAEQISDIANVLSVRIGDKPVELFVAIKNQLPHKLMGDAMRIRQVLINLANNAIKFTNSGMVAVEITGEELNDRYVEFTFHVIDTGIGIKKEDLDKLFESFQQVDSKRNRSVEGTGLGLAISKRLVGAMGGKMGVESEYGKGSDFWFSITQKITDPTDDLKVDDASEKCAFVLRDSETMVKMFLEETECLGVTGRVLDAVDEYVPSGMTDFVFMEEKQYDSKVRDFLKANKDVRGIILVPFDSSFVPDVSNLYVMKRPQTTMNMVRILNERFDENIVSGENELFRVDFEAPDARILVVDDNDINLTIAEGLMGSMGIKPDKASGGREAIDMATAGDYDIVFMDHMMPDVDGVEATDTIRKTLNSMIHPVIIALSANVVDEAKKLFKSAGMNDFVAKPIDIKDLAEKIKKWLPEEKIKPLDPGAASVKEADVPDAGKVEYELDTSAALKALGAVPLYDKILKEYYRSGQDKYDGIKNAYESKDISDYTIRVHALKSSSRQIGAMALGDMAEELEKAGKASDTETIDAKTGAVLDEFKKLLGALSGYYGVEDEADDVDKPPAEKEVLLALTKELEAACDDLDMDVMESVSERLAGFSYDDELRPVIESLQKAIGEMDTEECTHIISRVELYFS